MVVKNKILKQHKYGGNELTKEILNGKVVFGQSIKPIDVIIKKDYKSIKRTPFKKELAIDLDSAEIVLKSIKKGEQECTVDFSICLKNRSLLLVEAKLDVDNVDNISKSIKEKITYSRSLLLSELICNKIDEDTIILLKDDRFYEKSNRLKKMLSNNIHINPLRLNDFYDKFFKGA